MCKLLSKQVFSEKNESFAAEIIVNRGLCKCIKTALFLWFLNGKWSPM